MNILYYGYGKHSQLISRCVHRVLKERNINEYGIVRCNWDRQSSLPLFRSLQDALKSAGWFDCAFIATPSNSHRAAFADCAANGIKYIYVEKPAVGIEDEWYRISASTTVNYLQVGYQFVYDQFILDLKKAFDSEMYGKMIAFNMNLCHGLAFKKEAAKCWRLSLEEEMNGVVYTQFSHLLSILLFVVNGRMPVGSISSIQRNSIETLEDTCSSAYLFDSGLVASLTSSWASPAHTSIKAIFNDAIWEYDLFNLSVASPRDTFDEKGRFKAPTAKIEEAKEMALFLSVKSFLETAYGKKRRMPEFNYSSKIVRLIKDIRNQKIID